MRRAPSERSPRPVIIVAFDGCQLLDVIGPLEVFAGARAAQASRRAADPGYAPIVVAPGRGPITGESGLAIVPAARLASIAAAKAPPIDTLIVAGGAGARRAAEDPTIVRAIARAAGRARRVASVCTGTFVLAAAGLADHRTVTTHWAYCDRLAAQYPAITVARDPIFVRDGALWTSAGVTAGIDLALAMVEDDLGREVALLVARWLVVFVRRAGGQAQFSAQLAAATADRPSVRDLQAWIVDHPAEDLAVPALARRAAMSVRNFSRVFAAEIGVGPARYVERVRVETARRLLETTSASIDEVARGAGFGTAESLRRAFARQVGLAPREYRARFGARDAQPSSTGVRS